MSDLWQNKIRYGIVFCLINRIIWVKIGLFFQELTFKKEFPGSNFLLPSFLSGGKWDFQVVNLLLATVNFKPWKNKNCQFLSSSLLSFSSFLSCAWSFCPQNYVFEDKRTKYWSVWLSVSTFVSVKCGWGQNVTGIVSFSFVLCSVILSSKTHVFEDKKTKY